MIGIGVTIALGLGALAALHLWWRARYDDERLRAAAELKSVREHAEKENLNAMARLEALFDSMVEGVLILDSQSRIILANSAFLACFTPAAHPKGRTILEALRQHELHETASALCVGQKAATYKFELPDGRWVEVNGAHVASAANDNGGAVLVFHDLTEVKRLQRMREEFVGNVSHELRTPLSLIKGSAETLLESARNDPEATDRFLKMIDRNAERLRLLIEDLLTISELESGRIRLNFRQINLRALVEKVRGELTPRAAKTDAQILNDLPEIELIGDPDRLEQVFSNLVDNAIKYGKPNGRVVISASLAEEGFVRAEVRDDGPGIPPEAMGRVFERFYRVDKARSREQGGTGLGLAIVKHIVQSHGGKVWAESKPGQGATFNILLPLMGSGNRHKNGQATLPLH